MDFALISNKKNHEQLYYGIYIKETKEFCHTFVNVNMIH